MINREDVERLLQEAWKAREAAYAPYSQYSVGASVLGENGMIYSGCNIENASYGMTVCAERTAIFKMVSEGCRRFTALAVVDNCEEDSAPCMVCRQVMTEFCESGDTPVYVSGAEHTVWEHTVKELCPLSFAAFEKNADYHE